MKILDYRPAPRIARRACALVAVWLLATPVPARAFINYTWNAAVSGSTDDPARWSPYGVPGWADNQYYGYAGTYTVTYPASAPNTSMISFGGGNVTFNVNSPHTTKEFLVGAASGSPTLTVAYGRINSDYLNLGYPGSLTRLTLTGSSITGSALLHTYSMNNRYYGGVGGDVIGYSGGITYLDVFGGAQYVCERTQPGSWPLRIAVEPAAVATVSIAGRNANLFQYSSLGVTGSQTGDGLVVAESGTANLFVYNGGFINVAGGMTIAQLQNSSAWVTVGPVATFGTSSIRTSNYLAIGYNQYDTLLAGHGELTVKSRAYVAVGGRCDVGDPDNDAGSLLRVAEGGTFRVNGGIKFWPTTGPALDLRGGLTHVRGGAFLWPANKYLTVSSQVGNPELAISSGVISTGPSTPAFNAQLFVGRGGAGKLRLSQLGTNFSMGAGSTIVGDSLGSVGTVIVDSLATLSSGGPVYLGNRGNGFLEVRHGAVADVGTMAIGVSSTGLGSAIVRGSGSYMQVRDNLWIGGGYNGIGSTATVEADSGATVNVLHTTGVNPALTTIFDYGSLVVSYGGRLTTTGTVSNSGDIYLSAGEIEALNISQPAGGSISGWGRLVTMLQNSGRVSPLAYTGNFGRIQVDGSFTQFSGGRYRADLGTAAGLQCDSLDVSGAVTLDGTLELFTPAGFAGAPGDVFKVLTGHPVTGTFSSVTWNGSPLAGQAVVLYDPTSVRVLIPDVSTGVDDQPATAAELRFAPAGAGGDRLSFALDLPQAADVQVKVYDIRGREVATLQSGELGQGPHRLLDETGGRNLPSGVYIARAVVRAGGQTTVKTARTVIVR
jgi:T5SS/PEP-CTERM-associated repeat protein